jgi:hypothetical protein
LSGAALGATVAAIQATGFNDDFELTRRQTIMAGGRCCDFRFRRKT